MRLIFLFIFTLTSSFCSYAAEDELLINAVEYDKIIVNWNPNSNQLARIIASECYDCKIKNLIVNHDTQLEDENGNSIEIHELSKKVDWQGTILTTNRNPNIVIKILLH